MNRHHFLRALAGVAATSLLAIAAHAEPLSNRPIRIIVPFGAGGVADLTARTVGQKLSDQLGQPVVIDNRPGAGGVVAGEVVNKADPDGHTLLLMSNGTAVSAGLFKSLPFDAQKDFAPISLLGTFDIAIVVADNSRFKNLAELLTYAKANPGKLNIGTINVGSTQNLAAELFKTTASVDAQVVPFNGTPAVVTALRGGQIDAAVEILGPIKGQITGKALRALATMSDTRAAGIGNVPTVAESGGSLAKFDVSSWNALAAPAKTPRDVINRLNRELNAVLTNPEIKKKLAELNVDARHSTPEQLGTLLANETRRWTDVIVRANIPRQ